MIAVDGWAALYALEEASVREKWRIYLKGDQMDPLFLQKSWIFELRINRKMEKHILLSSEINTIPPP